MKLPRTFFSTPLSGSDSLVKDRIRNIVYGQRKRPPVWLMVLVVLMIACCGWLVSCQPMEMPGPDQSIPDGSRSDPSELLMRTDSPDGGEFLLRLEPNPGGEQYMGNQVGALCYRAPGEDEEQLVAYLEYGPDHHYWSSVSLRPFTDVLGYDGVVLGHDLGTGWHNIDYYGLVDGMPRLIAPCYNTAFLVDLDRDGQMELLSNYHVSGFLDLYQRQENGLVLRYTLNDAARSTLGRGLDEDTWVSLNAVGLMDDPNAPITATWMDEDGNWQEQEIGETWALTMVSSADAGLLPLDNGGCFLWSPGNEPFTMTAWWYWRGEYQALATVDLRDYPCVTFAGGIVGTTGITELDIWPYTDDQGQLGATLVVSTDYNTRLRQTWVIAEDHSAKLIESEPAQGPL